MWRPPASISGASQRELMMPAPLLPVAADASPSIIRDRLKVADLFARGRKKGKAGLAAPCALQGKASLGCSKASHWWILPQTNVLRRFIAWISLSRLDVFVGKCTSWQFRDLPHAAKPMPKSSISEPSRQAYSTANVCVM
jgi:hypothetical protein